MSAPSLRRLIGILAVTQSVLYGALAQALPVLLDAIAADLGVERATIASASVVSTLVGAVAAIPVGRVLDRSGGRSLMSAGAVLAVVAIVVWSQAATLAHVVAAFALIGLATAMCTYDAAFAVLVAVAEPVRRDTAIVAVASITGFATSLFYPFVGLLEEGLGWRGALLVLAGIVAVVAVPAHVLALPSRAAHAVTVRAGGGASVRDAVSHPRFWLLAVAFVAQTGSVTAFLLLMVSYFRDVGHPDAVATSIPVAVGVLQLLSRLGAAPLARRFGMSAVTTFAFAAQGVGLLLLPLVGASVPLALLCVAGFGLGYGIGVVARPVILADAYGVARFATIASVLIVPIALARAAAPFTSALLDGGRFLVVLGVAALLASAALLIATRMRPAP